MRTHSTYLVCLLSLFAILNTGCDDTGGGGQMMDLTSDGGGSSTQEQSPSNGGELPEQAGDESDPEPVAGAGDEIIEPTLEKFEISTEQTSVKTLELVLVSSNEINFNEESYKGKINDTEIDLIKTENNELLFIVPSELSIGSASLELIVDNKKGELSLDITENDVQNVESVINNELLVPFNEFETDLDDLITSNTNSSTVNEQLISAKQMLQDYKTKYNSLSSDEKMEVAKFFNANPIFTTDFLNLSNKSAKSLNGNSDYDCFKFNSKRVVYTTISILTFVHYLPHLTRVGPLGSVAALSGFVAGVYAAVAIISAAQEQLLNDCFLPFENLLRDSSGNTDNFELNNESNYTFSIISKDRKLISSDLNSSNSLLSSTVQEWNNAKQKWNTLKNGVNNIISSTTNWFSSWFGSSLSFKTITYEFEELPSSSDEIETEGASEFITIEDFPSDVEVEYSVASDNSINLKFKADESTLPRTIRGKIKYNDGDFSNEKEFSVTIEPIEFDFTGSWQISSYSANINLGVDYLHQQRRFTCDASGYASTSEIRFPTNSPPNNNWQSRGEFSIFYSNGKIIIDPSVHFEVIVIDFNDTVFYSENWNTDYTVNDYYWKFKLEKL